MLCPLPSEFSLSNTVPGHSETSVSLKFCHQKMCYEQTLCSCWASLLILFPVDVKYTVPLEIESPCLGDHCRLITRSLAVVSLLICRPCLLFLIAFHCWKEVLCYKGVSENAFKIKRTAFIKCLIRASRPFLPDQKKYRLKPLYRTQTSQRGDVMNFKAHLQFLILTLNQSLAASWAPGTLW